MSDKEPCNNTDHSSRVRIHTSPAKRYLWMLIGHFALVAGIVGLLLPLIPTSPFIIVAAYCYARSSERFYLILVNNRYFGKHIIQWEDNKCLRKEMKILIIVVLAMMFSTTILLFMNSIGMRLFGIALAGIAITTVWLIPTCGRD